MLKKRHYCKGNIKSQNTLYKCTEGYRPHEDLIGSLTRKYDRYIEWPINAPGLKICSWKNQFSCHIHIFVGAYKPFILYWPNFNISRLWASILTSLLRSLLNSEVSLYCEHVYGPSVKGILFSRHIHCGRKSQLPRSPAESCSASNAQPSQSITQTINTHICV